MRLLTHNYLVCVRASCREKSFPLVINAVQVERDDTEVTPEFVQNLLHRIDYPVLAAVAKQMGGDLSIPDALEEADVEDEAMIRNLHTYLLDTHVIEGSLECNVCGHVYPINNGIPNMLLMEEQADAQ